MDNAKLVLGYNGAARFFKFHFCEGVTINMNQSASPLAQVFARQKKGLDQWSRKGIEI